MKTWHIHIKGIVQGIGFRPFVFLLARKYGLQGWVNNDVDGVHIEFNAEHAKAVAFKEAIVTKPPVLAHITSINLNQTHFQDFNEFKIIHSKREGKANLLLTPDFALCPDCQAELFNPQNHRYHYPFITCTNCGPRFSIIHQLPYDRIHTKMDKFTMCLRCEDEYENPLDRRYYSQTNSCPDCPIELSLYDPLKGIISKQVEEIIKKVPQLWREGKIIAIKGIGGYLLTCDAGNEEAVMTLRKRKHRPTKPFAVMFPTLESLREFEIGEKEKEEFCSPVSPIVLLEKKIQNPVSSQLAPGLTQIGVMLPYTPLYELLLQNFQKPIIATSGNISNSPIVFQDKQALAELPEIADFLLMNNREIVIPQDDSVIKFSPFQKERIVLRRSRGLAPNYINAKLTFPNQCILATGAMLKSSLGLLHEGNTYLSQYLGDLAHFDTLESYRHTIKHFFRLFNAKPEVILCDKHPDYPSTRYAEDMAESLKIPVHRFQHHIAHFGAVLGENNQTESKTPVLGVIWDGTGLGDDGQMWGGEFFIYENYSFRRSGHFAYFDSILGDKMAREPRISALSACWGIEAAEELLKGKFTPTEWKIYTKILSGETRLQTSSVGRLFDAVAALLDLKDIQSYEGEAALLLEQLATEYCKENGLDFSASYSHYPTDIIPTQDIFRRIITDIQQGESPAFIAAKLHFSLAEMIGVIARQKQIKKIAFSGGVFQNGLLVDFIRHLLGDEFELFFHKQLSPNDENIAFGQMVCFQIGLLRDSDNHAEG